MIARREGHLSGAVPMVVAKILSGACAFVAFASAALAEPPTAAMTDPVEIGGVLVYRVETEGEAKIREALDQPLAIEKDETTLEEFVGLFAAKTGVAARLEKSRLEDYGISADIEIFAKAKETPVRVLLDEALPEHNLGWTIEDDALVVTVGDELPYRHRQRIYDITALAPRDDDPAVAAVYRDRREEIVEAIQATVAPDTWERRGGMGSAGVLRMNGKTLLVVSQNEQVFRRLELFLANLRRAAPALPAPPAEEPIVARIFPLQPGAAADDLVEVTKSFVAPERWSEEGVSIRRAGEVLLVRHRPAVQAQIRAMLASMGVLAGDAQGADEGEIGPIEAVDGVQIFGGIPGR